MLSKLFVFVGNVLGDCDSLGLPNCDAGSGPTIVDITNLVFEIIGVIAVIFLVIGGFRYVISGGDPNQAKQAKDTILYAVIGIIIAVSAVTIITFVTGEI